MRSFSPILVPEGKVGPRSRSRLLAAAVPVALVVLTAGLAADSPRSQRWLERFRFEPPAVSPHSVAAGTIGALPSFTVRPPTTGKHLLRLALPLATGALPLGLALEVVHGETRVLPDVRTLTLHPGAPASVRRAMLTFSWHFDDLSPRRFDVRLRNEPPPTAVPVTRLEGGGARVRRGGVTVRLEPGRVVVEDAGGDDGVSGKPWTLSLIAPPLTEPARATVEEIEAGRHHVWLRLLVPDPRWPRIIDLRFDSLGSVTVEAQLQRLEEGDGTLPEFGWRIVGPLAAAASVHSFAAGDPLVMTSADGSREISFPVAPHTRRGAVEVSSDGHSATYLRATPDERVPLQQGAWRTAALVLAKSGHTPRDELLDARLDVRIDAADFDAIHGSGLDPDLALHPVLDDARTYVRSAIVQCRLEGDDFGNVTGFHHRGTPSVNGMNRLNHCPAIFAEYYRSGDEALRCVAVQWCINMYNLSLWWGDTDDSGGTRYNNAFKKDPGFMWRGTGRSVDFCTKGFDAFFQAYEETGNPRMAVALRHQIKYARKYIHTDRGQCRNIGDALAFMRLHRFTGVEDHRQQALRLFRELRTKVGPDHLFSQSGEPIVATSPFINDDRTGYRYPFAKPYIIGYALDGLPELLVDFPGEPRLLEVVRAVAAFLAASQDPVGGWRYPHPRSTSVLVNQSIEHAAQIARAARLLADLGEPVGHLLDALELTLQARVRAFSKTGTFLAGVGNWEQTTGVLEKTTLDELYQQPEDRDPTRDYSDGTVSLGSFPPEGLVYFTEVLRFYLEHRPADRLFNASPQLARVLERVEDRRVRLIPAAAGSFLRIERPKNPDVAFRLWAPKWITFPELGHADEELGGMELAWQRDPGTGTVWYTIDREEATLTSCFVPHVDHVECFYTVWPKLGAGAPGTLGIGPCQQMHGKAFQGDESELLSRLWFLSGSEWRTIASVARSNVRNVQYIRGNPSPKMTGAMAESGWRTIQESRPDTSLIACRSRDGEWIAATAAEFSTSICNNADAWHRCIHSQGAMQLWRDGPTTLRVNAYLLRGSLEDLRRRHERVRRRWQVTTPAPSTGVRRTATHGLSARLPTFNEARVRRMNASLARSATTLTLDFATWKRRARATYLASLGPRPAIAPFAARVLEVEDRGTHEARKLAFNITADERVKAYLLVPRGDGPFPAVLALHDHGAHFSIGKSKVVRPFGEPAAVIDDARTWVQKYYGGRWIGDSLAARGHVVLAIDALFWGDRGRAEGVEYREQQALATNMFQLGLSWAGKIVQDDLHSVEFLRTLPEVAPERIGCIGLSMGAHRSWSLAAATDHIRAGAAICWLGDTPTLTRAGNNQTRGGSAFAFIHPFLRNTLDYPDVASIACPTPMLLYNGRQDGLFPVSGVKASYARMQAVWEERGVPERLVTKIWNVAHLFNREMQKEAFDWLAARLSE